MIKELLLPDPSLLPCKTDLKEKLREKPKERGGDMVTRGKPQSGAEDLGVVSAVADSWPQ